MQNKKRGVLVVNFNAPELNQLALALALAGRLDGFVRPYANKGRAWERALSVLPLGGRLYEQTFGRRQLADPALAALTHEAGVAFDWGSALIGRTRGLPSSWRHRWTNHLHMKVREAVALAGARQASGVGCVVAYEGFALPAFESARKTGAGRWLNYPVAHHRQRRLIREEELALEPSFAPTWPGFDDWGPGHEERLDSEIALADRVLLGSSFAADSFVAEGVPRDKLCVVPYGVDLQVFSPAPAASSRDIFKLNSRWWAAKSAAPKRCGPMPGCLPMCRTRRAWRWQIGTGSRTSSCSRRWWRACRWWCWKPWHAACR